MKKLSEIFDIKDDTLIKDIRTSSQDITPGDLFVCIQGVTEDRHNYINDAIEKGASAIVVSKNIKNKGVPIVKVKNTNEELEDICRRFYDNPQDKLELIGITGTDGKTTTSQIISKMLDAGYIGTLGAYYKDYKTDIINTTPAIETIYQIFNEFIKLGCKTVVMEVSSEAIYRGRVDNMFFDVSILTNITEDHLNVHKTVENYVNTKSKLFINTKKDGISILNKDDNYFDYIKSKCNGKIYDYGIENDANLKVNNYKYDMSSSTFEVSYQNNNYKFSSNLIGKYNIYNLSASILLMLIKGYSYNEIKSKLEHIERPEGRCEIIKTPKGSYIVLDYAHTTNGLYSVLSLINEIKTKRVITITGSAGGREQEKRKYMGKVVTDMSDYVIFTMDDPRWEDPNDIVKDMLEIVKKDNYCIELDRSVAIKKAIDLSEKEDIILVAGKGHDNYMLIEDKHVPFNDFDEIKKWIS